MLSQPQYGLRVTVVLSSGYRAPVESLSSAHSSSTVAEQLSYLARCQLHPSADYYPVQNWIIVSRWMHKNCWLADKCMSVL